MGNSINGGAGADTITVSAMVASGENIVNGGGGGDIITVSAISGAAGAALTSSNTINGGAGADTISLGGTVSGFVNTYATATESTIVSSNFDKISAGMVDADQDAIVVNASAIADPITNSGNNVLRSGAQAGQVLIHSGGTNVAQFSGTWSDADAVSALDQRLDAGSVAVYSINTDTFLFVQGGAQNGGTADDLVIEMSATSGGAATVLSAAVVRGDTIEVAFT
ncbi:hypothetical protein [Synechococcus sp. MU1611]|uniref:hypothetical protein n=1 Tax=Synechococcus sp. MU1611 TaxID=2508345 RepID=UPI001CF88061|nr:hypothetical protein [Synechococcus sp. MU1611]MCB4411499.1 hypothetical protein [Synechococcus sp. MU1611]